MSDAEGTTAGRLEAASADLVVGPDGVARPRWATHDELLRDYYDTEWGYPVHDERGIFERISLEVFQSGLSWATILRKRPAFRTAFCGFDPDVVAAFGDEDIDRLLADAAIVRNRAKILATINNAQATVRLRDQGGLATLVWSHRPSMDSRPLVLAEALTRSPESEDLARSLRAAGFRHVGPTTMFALMEAIGLITTTRNL